MEAVEFIKQKDRMCDYYSDRQCTHDDSGENCPAMSIDCGITTDKLEQLVAIVEKWAKEHPEETEQGQQKQEQNDAENHRTTSNELSIEDRIGILEQDMRIVQNFLYEGVVRVRHGHWKRYEDCGVTRCSVCDYSVEEYIEFRYCPYCGSKMDESVDKQKRTNKDALLEAFQNARVDDNEIPDICPRALDKNYNNCNDFSDCSDCKCAYWLAEDEE